MHPEPGNWLIVEGSQIDDTRDKGSRSRTLRDLRPWGPPELGGDMDADQKEGRQHH